MKKVFIIILILLAGFIFLTYWSVSSTSKEFKTCEIQEYSDLKNINFREHDSVLIAPSTLYQGDFLKNFMQGENYRKAWATPVKFPIAFLDTLRGGLQILKEGGGKQTHSLKLKNKEGTVYTLRSVNKDPKKLIPDVARDLGLENIIVDGISAQHPYAAILSAELSERANIAHTHPQIFFIPKQKILGKYNEKYGNRLFLLEFETTGKENWTSYNNIIEIVDTESLQELKQEAKKDLFIDRAALIKIRLFDLLIGDWDRHAEQWGWALQIDGAKIRAFPIPGDRDNAFFNLSGVIPSIITNKNIEPLVRPYEADIDHMPGLVYPFDRYFLIDTEKNLFIQQAKELQKQLSDKAIDKAFTVWPEQISRLDKKEIMQKIISRRDHLVEYAELFHSVIQKKGKLDEVLKGSENAKISKKLIPCFDCADSSLN